MDIKYVLKYIFSIYFPYLKTSQFAMSAYSLLMAVLNLLTVARILYSKLYRFQYLSKTKTEKCLEV